MHYHLYHIIFFSSHPHYQRASHLSSSVPTFHHHLHLHSSIQIHISISIRKSSSPSWTIHPIGIISSHGFAPGRGILGHVITCLACTHAQGTKYTHDRIGGDYASLGGRWTIECLLGVRLEVSCLLLLMMSSNHDVIVGLMTVRNCMHAFASGFRPSLPLVDAIIVNVSSIPALQHLLASITQNERTKPTIYTCTISGTK